MKEFSYEDIKSSTKDFSLDHLIGKGSHGYVYKAILRNCNEQVLAIKKRPSDFESSKLNNEIQVLSYVPKHPNLVNLVGVSRNPTTHDHKLLIMEFMPNGSLYSLLHSSTYLPICMSARMLIALQIARAIRVLHNASSSIIHRDIKSENILFDRRWNARLSDFSLAVKTNNLVTTPAPAGTLGYLDPSYTEASKLSPKNDVYSFGVLLLEIMSSRKAIDMDNDPSSIVSWAVPMIRKGLVLDVCDKRAVVNVGSEMDILIGRVLRVASRCVNVNEDKRPTMREVVRELREVVESVFSINWLSKCARIWNKCMKKRARMATEIVCEDHLIDGEDDNLIE